MNYRNLLLTQDKRVATVTVHRPDVLNALNPATMGELADVVRQLEEDAHVSVVVLTGAGDKAFVAGADISQMVAMDELEARQFSLAGAAVMGAIERSQKPWIAAVNGFALGGGCELALACDFIYAAKTARFGQPEVNLGVIPGFGGTQRLLRRVGLAKAKEIIFTGQMVRADEALAIGLCDLVCDPGELLERARKTALIIAGKGPLAIAAAKRVMQRGQSLALDDACDLESTAFSHLFGSRDQKEGMRAFLDKREARFEGK